MDLGALSVGTSGGLRFGFTAPGTLRDMLMQGVDEIALTSMRQPEIEVLRRRDRAARPWAY